MKKLTYGEMSKVRLTPYKNTNVRTNAAKITPYERTNLRKNVGKRTCRTKKTAVLNVLNFTISAHFS